MAGLNGLFDSDSDGSADFEGFNHFDVILAGRNVDDSDNSDSDFKICCKDLHHLIANLLLFDIN
jgi:hypothetical protein